MVDYTSTLQKLGDIDGKINNLNNLDDLSNILSQRSRDIYSILSSNNFFINDEVSTRIDDIESRLSIGGPLISEAQTEIARLVRERSSLPTGATSGTRRSEIGKELGKLLRITGGTETTPGDGSTTKINDRHNEYNIIKTAKNNFNIGSELGDHTYDLGTASDYTNLNSAASFGSTVASKFYFFDDSGNRLNSSGGKYKFKMTMIDGTESDVEVEGISINNTAPHSINFLHDVKFTPSNVDFSKPLELNIGGVYENVGRIGVNVVHIKKLKINLTNPDFLSGQPERNTEFDAYNTAGGGTKISDHLDTRNDIDLHDLERKAIERAIKDGDGPKYDQLSDDQKEQFYQQIRNDGHPSLGGTAFFDVLNPTLNLNDYSGFRDWFTHEDKDRNKGDNISSKRKYNDFIHNNLESKSTEYINNQLDSDLLKNLDTNRFLKSELTRFLNKIEENKQDSNIHSSVESALNNDDHKMKKGPRSILNNRDKNYMRFFSDSSKQIDNQKVNINTNSEPEDLNNPQPVKYNIKLDVSSKNNIQVSINIDGEQKEIIVKSGDPSALVQRVMRDQRIKHGKVRAHIAYNIYKGMIEMAKDKDISLTYRQDNEYMKQIDIDESGNIVLKTIDGRSDRNGANKTTTDVLFDQQMFENTNDFNEPGYNGSLRHGIEDISAHFNVAMNDVHKQYRRGVKRRLLGMVGSPSRPRLPSSIWLSPIKKMMNMGTNTKFDFDTTVESNGKQINISFKDNKFKVNMDGLKKEISSRDLGKVLRKRQGRKRVFDGMERDIVEGVYSSMIEQLRTNAKVARSNFGAIDDLTGNMYVLDEDGQFGLITKEQLDSKGNPVHWGMFNRNQYGVLSRKKLRKNGYEVLDESKTKELMKNPFLMQRLMKGMNKRMGFWESTRAIFN